MQFGVTLKFPRQKVLGAIWLGRNEVVFDKAPVNPPLQVIFRDTY